VQTAIDIGPVRPAEYAEAGAVTARAYEEFVPSDDESTGWIAYLERLADVAGRAERVPVLVARLDGAIAGTVTLETSVRINPESPQGPLAADEAHLRMLAVDPRFRGRGIGRALVLACIDEARRAGKRRITLDTTEDMRVALRMYAQLGFVPAGTSDRVPGMTLLTYELRPEG
jgi:GNAT superfamily N-acetyltransferase